jgi:3,4-dihydroxyphenylacetate 2,3-dioxygenase
VSLALSILGTHTPRMCYPEKVQDFQKPLAEAMYKASERLFSVDPEVLVLVSTHWVASFNHYIDATPVHEGILTAMECPDLISNLHYRYPGDSELARALVAAGRAAGLPVIAVEDPTYVWDYGSVVPLRYLTPEANLPVINMTVCLTASLEESYQLGRIIGRVLRESPKRAVFVASGALAHNLVRGPERTPTRMEKKMEDEFADLLVKGDLETAWQTLPQFAQLAKVESGGRHVATWLGVMGDDAFRGEYLGWGPSSGSGNPVIVMYPQA